MAEKIVGVTRHYKCEACGDPYYQNDKYVEEDMCPICGTAGLKILEEEVDETKKD